MRRPDIKVQNKERHFAVYLIHQPITPVAKPSASCGACLVTCSRILWISQTENGAVIKGVDRLEREPPKDYWCNLNVF